VKKQNAPGHKTVHPTVEEGMMLENGGESIAIGFTDKKLSPHAGSAVFWKFLHPSGFVGKLKQLLPHRLPESNNAIQPTRPWPSCRACSAARKNSLMWPICDAIRWRLGMEIDGRQPSPARHHTPGTGIFPPPCTKTRPTHRNRRVPRG